MTIVNSGGGQNQKDNPDLVKPALSAAPPKLTSNSDEDTDADQVKPEDVAIGECGTIGLGNIHVLIDNESANPSATGRDEDEDSARNATQVVSKGADQAGSYGCGGETASPIPCFMRFDVPKFSRTNPDRWIFSITEYFTLLSTPEVSSVSNTAIVNSGGGQNQKDNPDPVKPALSAAPPKLTSNSDKDTDADQVKPEDIAFGECGTIGLGDKLLSNSLHYKEIDNGILGKGANPSATGRDEDEDSARNATQVVSKGADQESLRTVSSVRKHIDDKLIPEVGSKTRWIKYVPIKVNVDVWKVKLDALPTRLNVSRRGIHIDSIMCAVCDQGVKTSRHLFFSCNMVRQTTRMITSWWDVSYEDFVDYDDWRTWIINLRLPSKNKMMLE
nr:RNA-directed DNA polymerase, eukaryota [Tanacetum cinerariifolium]